MGKENNIKKAVKHISSDMRQLSLHAYEDLKYFTICFGTCKYETCFPVVNIAQS